MHFRIKQILSKNLTDPLELPPVLPFRMIHLFTSTSRTGLRREILHFVNLNLKLRLIIATRAFGLGVGCPYIRHIIHWGAPNTPEELVQEARRAGRDGSDAEAVLFDIGGQCRSKMMKEYVENNSICRRNLLFQNFLFRDVQK